MATLDEEYALIRLAQTGDEQARSTLFLSHENFIRKIARRSAHGLDLDDAIAAGSEGFLVALDKFNPDYGVRLNTFARHYIAERVQHARRTADFIHIPMTSSSRSRVKAVARTASNLMQRGVAVNDDVIARETGLSHSEVRQAQMRHMAVTGGARVNIDDQYELADQRESPIENIEFGMRREILRSAAECLTDREKNIFLKRTAASERPWTLDELAQVYGVSRERIRQVEVLALGKVLKEMERLGVQGAMRVKGNMKVLLAA